MKTIIVGVDFTPSSYNASRYAAMLAKKTNCSITLFNMYEVPLIHSNSGLYFTSYTALRETSEKKTTGFAEMLRREFPKLKIGHFTSAGLFKSEIELFIKTHHVKFVVLGLSTKDRFSKFLYGSHTTDIVSKVSAPVIIVPDQYKKHSLKKIVLSVDNSLELHRPVLKPLDILIKETKSNVSIVHVRTEHELFVEKHIPFIKLNAKKVTVDIIEATTFQMGIKKYTRRNKPDMICLLSGKHSVLYNLFTESNTKQLIFATKIPVLSIHE